MVRALDDYAFTQTSEIETKGSLAQFKNFFGNFALRFPDKNDERKKKNH
jgi:hypothetical protein